MYGRCSNNVRTTYVRCSKQSATPAPAFVLELEAAVKVAIAGWAWRTPLGATIDAAIARLRAGERAVVANPRAAGFACTVAAPIVDGPTKPRTARFLRRMGLHGMDVAREAL